MVGGMTTPHQVPEFGLGRFPDDRFGMFVHWGPYSLIGADGWGMFRERYSIDEYERFAARFNDGFSRYDPSLSDDKLTKAAGRNDGLVSTVRLELS
jgi:hypothetical protein